MTTCQIIGAVLLIALVLFGFISCFSSDVETHGLREANKRLMTTLIILVVTSVGSVLLFVDSL